MTVIGILTGHPAAIWAVLACSLKLKESKAKGGGLVVEGVSGNAAKSGIKPGDTIIYASSWFGDELWPTDKLSFTISAIQRAPSPVAFVYVRAALNNSWSCECPLTSLVGLCCVWPQQQLSARM
jgi:hypothetical protein